MISQNVMTEIMSNPRTYALIFLVLLILLIVIFKRESFDGVIAGMKEYAEFPSSFSESILPDFVKDVVYDNYFTKPSEKVMPMEIPSSYLEIPTHTVNVPIDIGNGMAVNANIQVPSQTVDLPAQVPVAIPEPVKTDVVITAQQVQLPAQTGIIPTTVDGSSEILPITVDIPAQVVTIPEQQAIIPSMEPFRM